MPLRNTLKKAIVSNRPDQRLVSYGVMMNKSADNPGLSLAPSEGTDAVRPRSKKKAQGIIKVFEWNE